MEANNEFKEKDLNSEEISNSSEDSKKQITKPREHSTSESGEKINKKKIHVDNIEFNVHENLLKKFLSKFGTVKKCKIIRNNITNKSRGFGFVEFETEEDASKLVSCKEEELYLNSRQMHVSYYKEKKRDHSKKHTNVRNTPISTSTAQNVEVNDAQDEPKSENSITIQDLPFDILSKVFSFLCLRDLCTVERGN